MGVRYTNRAITTEQQIDILKERGLLIDDVERAVKALDIISYFVLLVIGDILKLTTLRINLEKVVVLQILSTCIPLISNLGLCSLLPFKRLKLLFAQNNQALCS